MVAFEAVSKVYADGTRAVDELSLEIGAGEFVVLIGPSGCGKTTTLKMINRIEEPTAGMISLEGRPLSQIDPVELRRGIGYVIQEIGLMPHLTVGENIAMVPNLLKWPARKVRERVDYLLEMAGLEPKRHKHRLPAQLSGGQQQRIGVLRALAADPAVVLMDEPFGALDPITKGKLQSELLELQAKVKKTIVFVTHDIDEALKMGDRVVLMRRGRIEQMGPGAELQNAPKNEFVRNFLGEDRLAQITPDSPLDLLIEEAPLSIEPHTAPRRVLELLVEYDRDTAQAVEQNGRWRGMVYLSDAKRADERGEKTVAPRRNRVLTIEESTVRDAAELLVDTDAPVPVIDANGVLRGLVTTAGVARLTLNRLARGAGEALQ